jgi:hypothetical protein
VPGSSGNRALTERYSRPALAVLFQAATNSVFCSAMQKTVITDFAKAGSDRQGPQGHSAKAYSRSQTG